MDITSVTKAFDEFNNAEPPTTKKAAKALATVVTESGIKELEEWLEELTEQVAEARSSVKELAEADSDDREGCYETATADVAEVLALLSDITSSG